MPRTTLPRETSEYLAFTRRILAAAGQHVALADPEDLTALIALATELDRSILTAIRGMRASGATWADIGAATGTSRQYAWLKWHKAV